MTSQSHSLEEKQPCERASLSRVALTLNLLIPTGEEIRLHRPILAPVLLGWTFALVSTVSLRPLVLGAFQGDQAAVGSAVELWLWIVALFSPALQVTKAIVLAALTWALLTLQDTHRDFRTLFSITLYGDAIVTLHGVFLALYLHLFGPGGAMGHEGLLSPFGLAALVPADSLMMQALAQSVTVFHLLWWAFIAWALRRVLAVRTVRATMLATLLWAAVAGVALLRTAFAA